VSGQSRLAALVSAVGADVKVILTRVLPPGGTAGQALVKSSGTDYAVQWSTVSSGGQNTTYYQSLNPAQAFVWSSGNTFTLSSQASLVVSVDFNGQALQPSEYALTNSTTVTVTLESTSFVAGDKVVITTVQVGSFTGTSSQDLEITEPTKGVILRSPNGTRYRLTVTNGGGISTAVVS